MTYVSPIESKLNSIEDKYPLSFMQQGLLFNSLYEPQSGVNIEQLVCELHEDLKVETFKQAWHRVVERHPLLRTSFCWQGVKEPLQQVHQQVTVPFEEQDWRGLSAREQEHQLKTYLEADRRRGFQLTSPPLMRLALFQVAQGHYQVVWTFHHALLDGRSFPLVLKEVFAFYEAFCQNQDLQLPQPRPYRDYIDWLANQDFTKAENFWRSTLGGFSAATPLTVDRAREANEEEQCRDVACNVSTLSRTLTSALQSLAIEHQLTVNTLIQGAWALLLSRYSGEEDVVFGATRACRRSAMDGAESMVGLFINTLPMRVRVPGEMPLLQWLKGLRETWVTMRDYEHTPLVEVQRWSDIPGGKPLFESLVVFENYELNSALRAQGGNWQNREFRLFEQTNYPLTLAGYLEPELLLKIAYNRGRFDDATIARMLGHIKTLLEGMVANPEQRLSDLPLLTAAERHQVLVEWNNASVDYPKDACIHQLFEAQVEQTPDAVAVVCRDVACNVSTLTYRELNTRANQLAHYLRSAKRVPSGSLGVKPDVLVGVCIERSLEMAVAFLGILKAGGAYIPIDPAYPQERRTYQIQDSQLSVILTRKGLVPSLPDHNAAVVLLDADWEAIAQQSQENPVSKTTPENLAYAIYTSGSTGKPKGAMITHQGMVNQNPAIAGFLNPKQDRVLQFSSMSFDIIVAEIFPAWISGATVILRPEEILSTTDLLRFIAQEQVTVMHLPTAFWHELVNGLSLVKEPLPACLRLVFIGGEKASRSAYLKWLQLVGEYPRLLNAYGPTETTVTATIYDPAAAPPNHRSLSEIPIGRPIANAQVYILDRQLQPVPIGVPGELHIGGAGVGRGYLNRPELTASSFIRNPFIDEPDARLYKTGDKARYLPDGNIEFLGRIDYQVKIRGFRVEPGEIEAVLEQNQAVQRAVVLAREDVPGEKRLVAYVIPTPKQALTTTELRSFLQERLPDYMVPAAFVMLDALPLTPNGKVDRRALPVPDGVRQEREETFVAPQDDLESAIVKIWEQVLGIQPIGVRDNLFALGGHSLLAVRLSAQIEKAFNTNLPLATIFQAPTVEQLASILRHKTPSSSGSSLAAIQPDGTKPPLFLCEGVGIYHPLVPYLGLDQPLYGLVALSADGHSGLFDRVEELAAHYIQEMRTLQPEGPYFLAGISFGGVTAFEMAQQLVAQGEKVALLALFDTILPGARRPLPIRDRFSAHLREILQLGPAYVLSKLNQKIERIQEKSMRIYGKFHLKRQRVVPHTLEHFAMREVKDQAVKDYIPKVYPGRVTLFRATDRSDAATSDIDPLLGWGDLAAGGVEIHDVPGDHIDILKEPHVRVLGEKLRDCLDKARAGCGF